MSETPLRLAARQGGIILRQQLLDLGVPKSTISYRVAQGKYEVVVDGVYRLLRLDMWEDKLLAALTGLPNAIASHQSAAALHRFPEFSRKDVVVTVPAKTTHLWPGATVRRANDLAESHVARVGRLRCTTPERTLFDLAAILSESSFRDTADSVFSRGIADMDRFGRVAGRVCRKGKPGSAAVRRYLEERSDSGVASPLEARGIALLKGIFADEFVVQYRLPWDDRRRFDVAFPRYRVAVEWDSRTFHSSAVQFEADRRRDRQAILHGWVVLRFTWEDVVDRPDEVVGELLRVLQDRSVASF